MRKSPRYRIEVWRCLACRAVFEVRGATRREPPVAYRSGQIGAREFGENRLLKSGWPSRAWQGSAVVVVGGWGCPWCGRSGPEVGYTPDPPLRRKAKWPAVAKKRLMDRRDHIVLPECRDRLRVIWEASWERLCLICRRERTRTRLRCDRCLSLPSSVRRAKEFAGRTR